jgi:hypothetical protein
MPSQFGTNLPFRGKFSRSFLAAWWCSVPHANAPFSGELACDFPVTRVRFSGHHHPFKIGFPGKESLGRLQVFCTATRWGRSPRTPHARPPWRFCRSIRLAKVDSIRQNRSSRAAFLRCPNDSSECQIAFRRRRRLDQETGRRP